jgi:DNA sulfur modification protein DndC
MSKLLGTEYQYQTKARRIGIYEAIENCFETSSRDREEAIKNAHSKRDLKTAVDDGSITNVKEIQLTWAQKKFGKTNLENPSPEDN